MSILSLSFDLEFEDLYSRDGVAGVDAAFLGWLEAADVDLSASLTKARADPGALSKALSSDLILAVAPHLDDFVVALFGIERAAAALAKSHHRLAPLYSCKRLFVQRRAVKKYGSAADAVDADALRENLEVLMGAALDTEAGELSFSHLINSVSS